MALARVVPTGQEFKVIEFVELERTDRAFIIARLSDVRLVIEGEPDSQGGRTYKVILAQGAPYYITENSFKKLRAMLLGLPFIPEWEVVPVKNTINNTPFEAEPGNPWTPVTSKPEPNITQSITCKERGAQMLKEKIEEVLNRQAVKSRQVEDSATNERALEKAEKMADQFKSVKPQQYFIPIERFVGLPTYHSLQTETK